MKLSFNLIYDSSFSFDLNGLSVPVTVGTDCDFTSVLYSFANSSTSFGVLKMSVPSPDFCSNCTRATYYPNNCFIAHGYRFRATRHDFDVVITVETL